MERQTCMKMCSVFNWTFVKLGKNVGVKNCGHRQRACNGDISNGHVVTRQIISFDQMIIQKLKFFIQLLKSNFKNGSQSSTGNMTSPNYLDFFWIFFFLVKKLWINTLGNTLAVEGSHIPVQKKINYCTFFWTGWIQA